MGELLRRNPGNLVRNLATTSLLALAALTLKGQKPADTCTPGFAKGLLQDNLLNNASKPLQSNVCIEQYDPIVQAVKVSDPKDRSKHYVMNADEVFKDSESAKRFDEAMKEGAYRPTQLNSVCKAPLGDEGERKPETGTPSGRVPSSTVQGQPFETIAETGKAIEDHQAYGNGSELVERTENLLNVIQKKEAEDQGRVERAFLDLAKDPRALSEGLARAEKRAAEAVADLDSAKDINLLPGETMRYRNMFEDVRALSSKMQRELAATTAGSQMIGALAPFKNVFQGMSSKSTRGLASVQAKGQVTRETLVQRSLMLNALPPQTRDETIQKLNHTIELKMTLPNGQVRRSEQASGWYRLGPNDCSSFVSQVLFKHRVYTLDLRAIYGFKKDGSFPRPPLYPKRRLRLLKDIANDLSPIDVYAGDELRPGDLLGMFVMWDQRGHVMQVTHYDPVTKNVSVIDATQGTGTVNKRDVNLSVYPLSASHRPLRPGWFALRPMDKSRCGPSGGKSL